MKKARDDQEYMQDKKARSNDFLKGKRPDDIEKAKKLICEEIFTYRSFAAKVLLDINGETSVNKCTLRLIQKHFQDVQL
jgi:hypothetical protein